MTANRLRAVCTGQAVPDCSQLFVLVRAVIEVFGPKLFRTGQKRSDQQICRVSGLVHPLPVHLRKCRFELFRTGRNKTPFALVKLFRTAQNSFCPSSEATVSLSLSIERETGPSPIENNRRGPNP